MSTGELAGLEPEPTLMADPVIRRAVDELEQSYGSELAGVLLYGSRARGDHRPDSDYDLAVVFRDDLDRSARHKQLGDLAWRLMLEASLQIHFWPLTLPELGQVSGHLHNLRKDAVPVLRGPELPTHISRRRPLPTEPRTMKVVTADELTRADETYAEAKQLAVGGHIKVAAREAYLAAFHAARAVIFEKEELLPKTHSGTRSLFHQLGKGMRSLSPDLAAFLSEGEYVKHLVDYGDRSALTEPRALQALAEAERFIAMARRMIAEIEATRDGA